MVREELVDCVSSESECEGHRAVLGVNVAHLVLCLLQRDIIEHHSRLVVNETSVLLSCACFLGNHSRMVNDQNKIEDADEIATVCLSPWDLTRISTTQSRGEPLCPRRTPFPHKPSHPSP